MAYWSYSCGRKGVSRVRVYERSVAPGIYVEWTWQGERTQRSLKTVTGHPVTDRKLAMQIAHEMSRNLERDHNKAAARAMFGRPGKDHTLADLLNRMHKHREADWSSGHTTDQETLRRYWLERLGDSPVVHITEAMVEALTAETAKERTWNPRTLAKYRQYMAEAFTFAADKLKWLEPRHKLTALDIPKRRSKSLPYSLDEVRRLLPALEAEDPRAGWIGHVAFQSGRRLRALRTFPAAGVDVRAGYTVLAFPGATDKTRRSGEVVVVGRAHELTRQLLGKAKHLLGDPPPSHELCIKGWLARAEKAAGIAHVPGRAYHGLKRRYAGVTQGMAGRDRQSGTTEARLSETYRPDDLAPKREVAEAVNKMLDGDTVPDTD